MQLGLDAALTTPGAQRRPRIDMSLRSAMSWWDVPIGPYAYLLGQYLGDGCISAQRRGNPSCGSRRATTTRRYERSASRRFGPWLRPWASQWFREKVPARSPPLRCIGLACSRSTARREAPSANRARVVAASFRAGYSSGSLRTWAHPLGWLPGLEPSQGSRQAVRVPAVFLRQRVGRHPLFFI